MGSVALSGPARRLWGKSDRAENAYWLPLYVHLSDAGHVAGYLWDQWVPEGTRSVIAKEFGDPDGEQAQKRARQLLVFLASVHDIGKATPVFQSQPTTHVGEHQGESLSGDAYLRLFRPVSEGGAGFLCSQGLKPNHPPHAIAGQILLEKYLEQAGFPASDEISGRQASGNKSLRGPIRESLVCVVGGHHGREPHSSDVRDVKKNPYTLDAIAETRSGQQDSIIHHQRESRLGNTPAGFSVLWRCGGMWRRRGDVTGLLLWVDNGVFWAFSSNFPGDMVFPNTSFVNFSVVFSSFLMPIVSSFFDLLLD